MSTKIPVFTIFALFLFWNLSIICLSGHSSLVSLFHKTQVSSLCSIGTFLSLSGDPCSSLAASHPTTNLVWSCLGSKTRSHCSAPWGQQGGRTQVWRTQCPFATKESGWEGTPGRSFKPPPNQCQYNRLQQEQCQWRQQVSLSCPFLLQQLLGKRFRTCWLE